MYKDSSVIVQSQTSVFETNRVLRNTYFLLSLTLLFSGGVAWFAMQANVPYPSLLVALVGMYGLLFLTQALRNSAWGLVSTFALTGFIGYTMGPLVNAYMHHYSNGGQLVAAALGATGVIFLSLSAYVLTTKKDFSYLAGFLFVGLMTALIGMIAGFVFNIPALHLMVAGAFVLMSAGYILLQTSLIVQGGERNYILATVSLYVSIYNLFISLLQIFSAFSGRE